MFRLQFKTDNAAFADNPHEIVDILHAIADKAGNGATSGYVRDSNGNHIGEWSLV